MDPLILSLWLIRFAFLALLYLFLFSVVRDGAFVHVAMGSLVDAPTIRPTAHIFVGSKAPWFEITDRLPQYQGHVVKA